MRVFAFTVLLFTMSSFVPHEYYVATFNLEYNVDKMQIEGEIKVFSDDLERLLKTRNGSALDLGKSEHREKIMELLSVELQQKIIYTDVKGNVKPVVYLGLEADVESTHIYFTIDKIKRIKDPELQITWMLDLFPEQVNIIHFKNGEGELTEYYSGEKTKHDFVF